MHTISHTAYTLCAMLSEVFNTSHQNEGLGVNLTLYSSVNSCKCKSDIRNPGNGFLAHHSPYFSTFLQDFMCAANNSHEISPFYLDFSLTAAPYPIRFAACILSNIFHR